MSREDVELVKSIHPPTGTDLVAVVGEAESDPGRLDGLAPLFTSDFEAVSAEGLTPGGKGVAGLLSAWREWLEPWERYLVEVEDFIDLRDGRIVALNRDRGRMRGSDAEVDVIGAAVWTVREGKVARIQFFTDRRAALSAVGLDPA
jgi:ketosteroid isomerase-like protein